MSVDASFGLGAVIAQQQPTGEWHTVVFQSQSMLPAEQRYSQIQKEALVITWACETFSHYLIGMTFHVQTPTPLNRSGNQTFLTEVVAFVAVVNGTLPATYQWLEEIMENQADN